MRSASIGTLRGNGARRDADGVGGASRPAAGGRSLLQPYGRLHRFGERLYEAQGGSGGTVA